MTDPTAEFFEELGRLGHQPLLEKVRSAMRFDIVDGKRTDHWLLTVDKGDVAVSHENAAADCVVRADKELFGGIASGEVNAFAAVLRGALAVEGDPGLLVLFQRLLPSPPPARKRQHSAGQRRKK
jgi:putative sterol carrier protein